MATATKDRRISDLIDEAQQYSNPTGQEPAAPSRPRGTESDSDYGATFDLTSSC